MDKNVSFYQHIKIHWFYRILLNSGPGQLVRVRLEDKRHLPSLLCITVESLYKERIGVNIGVLLISFS